MMGAGCNPSGPPDPERYLIDDEEQDEDDGQ
jgi:hypothetical protein